MFVVGLLHISYKNMILDSIVGDCLHFSPNFMGKELDVKLCLELIILPFLP